MYDVERICDQIAVLNNTELILKGNLEDIKNKHQKHQLFLELTSTAEAEEIINDNNIKKYTHKCTCTDNSIIFETKELTNLQRYIINYLAKNDIQPVKFEVVEPSLENLFEEVVK